MSPKFPNQVIGGACPLCPIGIDIGFLELRKHSQLLHTAVITVHLAGLGEAVQNTVVLAALEKNFYDTVENRVPTQFNTTRDISFPFKNRT